MAFFSWPFMANFSRHYFGYFNLSVFGYFCLTLTAAQAGAWRVLPGRDPWLRVRCDPAPADPGGDHGADRGAGQPLQPLSTSFRLSRHAGCMLITSWAKARAILPELKMCRRTLSGTVSAGAWKWWKIFWKNFFIPKSPETAHQRKEIFKMEPKETEKEQDTKTEERSMNLRTR